MSHPKQHKTLNMSHSKQHTHTHTHTHTFLICLPKQHKALNKSHSKHSICPIQNNTKHLICLIQNTHCVLSKTTQDAQCLIQNNTNTQNFSSKVGVVYLMYHRVIKLLMCSCQIMQIDKVLMGLVLLITFWQLTWPQAM